MTISKHRSARSSKARSPQSPRLSAFETSAFETSVQAAPADSPTPLPPRSSLRKLTLALLLTVAIALLLAALILYAPATALIKLKQLKLSNLHQTQQTMLSRAQSYWTQSGEASQIECIAEAHRLVETKPQAQLYAQAQDVLKDCQDALATLKIAEAQRQADGHQADAIALVSKVEGSMQPQAIALSKAWTEQILTLAKTAYNAGNFPGAQQMLVSLTPDNPLYREIQADLQAWKQEWATNAAALETAKVALRTDQLDIAQTNLDRVTSHPYWQAKLKPVAQTLRDRQAEFDRIYAEAQQHLDHGDYDGAGQVATQLPDSPPWAIRKHQIVQQVDSARQKDNAKAIGFSWLLGALSSGLLSLKFKRH